MPSVALLPHGWRVADDDDRMIDQLNGCVVKMWPDWPKASSRAVVARSLGAREASRTMPLAQQNAIVVELLCGTISAIRGAQQSLEHVVGDTASALEWMSLALKCVCGLLPPGRCGHVSALGRVF